MSQCNLPHFVWEEINVGRTFDTVALLLSALRCTLFSLATECLPDLVKGVRNASESGAHLLSTIFQVERYDKYLYVLSSLGVFAPEFLPKNKVDLTDHH